MKWCQVSLSFRIKNSQHRSIFILEKSHWLSARYQSDSWPQWGALQYTTLPVAAVRHFALFAGSGRKKTLGAPKQCLWASLGAGRLQSQRRAALWSRRDTLVENTSCSCIGDTGCSQISSCRNRRRAARCRPGPIRRGRVQLSVSVMSARSGKRKAAPRNTAPLLKIEVVPLRWWLRRRGCKWVAVSHVTRRGVWGGSARWDSFL